MQFRSSIVKLFIISFQAIFQPDQHLTRENDSSVLTTGDGYITWRHFQPFDCRWETAGVTSPVVKGNVYILAPPILAVGQRKGGKTEAMAQHWGDVGLSNLQGTLLVVQSCKWHNKEYFWRGVILFKPMVIKKECKMFTHSVGGGVVLGGIDSIYICLIWLSHPLLNCRMYMSTMPDFQGHRSIRTAIGGGGIIWTPPKVSIAFIFVWFDWAFHCWIVGCTWVPCLIFKVIDQLEQPSVGGFGLYPRFLYEVTYKQFRLTWNVKYNFQLVKESNNN